jgi:hypothetical protein
MSDRPVTGAYFYRIAWGHLDEWLELYERNHLPLLLAQVETGRIRSTRTFTNRFHGDGAAAWQVMVTIEWRDWAAMEEHADAGLVGRLYPDRERHTAEERRRFELMEAHWDVVLEERPATAG